MTKIRLVKKIIKNHFLDLEKNQRKFVPGKSKIPLAFPPYGANEVFEALDSMMRLKTTMDTKVRKFEREFAKYVGTKHSIMVNSGSSANLLALSILTNPLLRNKRIKTGDEVLTPAVTWPTTVYPIVNVGAIPKFVDVNLDDFSINASPDEMVGLLKGINIVAKKLGISVDTGKGYRALANISEDGGQEVPHLHFHLFGGEKVGKMVE